MGLCSALRSIGLLPKHTYPKGSAFVRISALADGKILVDGAVATQSELDEKLEKLKELGGVVWYYREFVGWAPTPKARVVTKTIFKHAVPLFISGKADFSDVIEYVEQAADSTK